MDAQNMQKAPAVMKESKNKIKVDFERTPLIERLKGKYLTVNFLASLVFKIFRLVLLVGISYVILFPFFAKISGSFMSPEDFRSHLSQNEFILRQATNRQELLDAFIKIFQKGLNDFVIEQKKAGSKHIQLAKRYISEHYAENVALEDIAKIAFVNPAYLSVLFKKEEGINFSDYLMQFRIEKAKELLRSGQKLSIDQISALVGYQDSRYFSKLFTRLVGIKPSDYRRLY